VARLYVLNCLLRCTNISVLLGKRYTLLYFAKWNAYKLNVYLERDVRLLHSACRKTWLSTKINKQTIWRQINVLWRKSKVWREITSLNMVNISQQLFLHYFSLSYQSQILLLISPVHYILTPQAWDKGNKEIIEICF